MFISSLLGEFQEDDKPCSSMAMEKKMKEANGNNVENVRKENVISTL